MELGEDSHGLVSDVIWLALTRGCKVILSSASPQKEELSGEHHAGSGQEVVWREKSLVVIVGQSLEVRQS